MAEPKLANDFATSSSIPPYSTLTPDGIFNFSKYGSMCRRISVASTPSVRSQEILIFRLKFLCFINVSLLPKSRDATFSNGIICPN